MAAFFDIHTHYRWDQAENTSPEQALAYFKQAGVKKAVVIGRPAEFALKLYTLAPDMIIPFYGPYLSGGEKFSWQFRTELIDEARQGLASGLYHGIGELHLIGGLAVNWRRGKVFPALLALAREYNVPILLHTEYSSNQPTIDICQSNPDNRILLAHAGGVLSPAQVEEILVACPNLIMDLSAREPGRYVKTQITDADGKLIPAWHEVIMRHSSRFTVGSDPVWPLDKGTSWDEADQGWTQLQRFVDFHRRWLSFLPDDVAEKIRWSNAETWLLSKPE
jgi:hypothetical protein